jgi:integrase
MASISSYETSQGEKRYRVRYRKPDNSQTDKRGFKTKKEAELFSASTQVQLARGDYLDPSRSKVTMAWWIEQWFTSLVNIRPTTRAGYRQTIDKHIVPTWGPREIGSIGHAEVQSWVSTLSKTLSPSSVRQIFFNLRTSLYYAISDERLTKNVCENIRLPALSETSRPYLDHDQVIQLSDACGDEGDIILVLAYTGMRVGELVALRVGSIDFTTNRLNITESISEVSGKLTEGPPKGGKGRSIPFPMFLSPILLERIGEKGKAERVFLTKRGDTVRMGNFRRDHFNKAIKALKELDPDFPHVTPHDLRHTTASLAISAGANIKALQRMLGHAKASMTLDTYADLFDDDLDAVSIALNDIAGPSFVGKMWAKAEIDATVTPPETTKTPA